MHRLLQSALIARALILGGAYTSPIVPVLEPFTARAVQRSTQAGGMTAAGMALPSVDRHALTPPPHYAESRRVSISLRSRTLRAEPEDALAAVTTTGSSTKAAPHVATAHATGRALASKQQTLPLQALLSSLPSSSTTTASGAGSTGTGPFTFSAAFPSHGVTCTLTITPKPIADDASSGSSGARSAGVSGSGASSAMRTGTASDAVLAAILGNGAGTSSGSLIAAPGATGSSPEQFSVLWRLAVTDATGKETVTECMGPSFLTRLELPPIAENTTGIKTKGVPVAGASAGVAASGAPSSSATATSSATRTVVCCSAEVLVPHMAVTVTTASGELVDVTASQALA